MSCSRSLLKEYPALMGYQVLFTWDACVNGLGGRADERVYAMDALQRVDDRNKDSWSSLTDLVIAADWAWVGSFI